MPADRRANPQFAPTRSELRHYSLTEKFGAFILLNTFSHTWFSETAHCRRARGNSCTLHSDPTKRFRCRDPFHHSGGLMLHPAFKALSTKVQNRGKDSVEKYPIKQRRQKRRILPLCVVRHGRNDEPLETRIVPERIEHRIEPEQRRSERCACGSRTVIRDRQKFLQSGNGAVRLV